MTATRTTHTKLTFYQVEGGRGGTNQERGQGPRRGGGGPAPRQEGCASVRGAGGGSFGRQDLPVGGTPYLDPAPPSGRDTRVPEGAAVAPAPPRARAPRSQPQSRGPLPGLDRWQIAPNFPKLPRRSPAGCRLLAPAPVLSRPRPPPRRLLLGKKQPPRRRFTGNRASNFALLLPAPEAAAARGAGGRAQRRGRSPGPRPAHQSAALRGREARRRPACPRGPPRACGRGREPRRPGAAAPASGAEGILAVNILQECK